MVNYLMTYIGDKGREIYQTLDWLPARQEEGVNIPPENEMLEGAYNKYVTVTENVDHLLLYLEACT